MNRREAIKKLQNLYSWEDFYIKNSRPQQFTIKEEIINFKNEYKLK